MIKLTKKQQQIIEDIKNWLNVLITWWAWTWKSYLLQELKSNYLFWLPVTASTWIAAVNVWWSTLHSFAWLGLAEWPAEAIASRIIKSKNHKYKDRIKSIPFLAIDEVSMIPMDLFDKLDKIFKIIRKNNYPFWWVQMILFWDFLQLPPINKSWNEIEFLFESNAFKDWYFKIHVLEKVFRQQDNKFIALLNNLRMWNALGQDLKILSERSSAKIDENNWIKAVKIVTHNYQADLINNSELEKIESKKFSYKRKERWEEYAINNLRKNCLAPDELELKIWTQVMCLRNTHQEEWIVNWSLWIVEDFDEDDFPIIKFNNWKVKTMEYDSWIFEEYNADIWESVDKGRIQQIPLRLAYAITVHKSQWMTLDKIECDLWSAFTEGQVYVALSRVKTLDWLYLKSFNPNKIVANTKVISFYNNIE